MVAGLLILALDCIVDIFWFMKHIYKGDLDSVASKKKESSGLANNIDRKTFKKILTYFEAQNTAEMQQIAL